jgi:hypothetical protein
MHNFRTLRFESHYDFRIQRVKLHRKKELNRLILYKVGCRVRDNFKVF